ncbi:hypothetical protein GQ53DRAFT_824027 [Thozetella sp. PMI_491]|nr:hypothetical protein GQ53DRAFT_824027 [Thozetella sp. PMI_491]
MASKRSHEENMAIATQLQAEFSRGGPNRGSGNSARGGRSGRGVVRSGSMTGGQVNTGRVYQDRAYSNIRGTRGPLQNPGLTASRGRVVNNDGETFSPEYRGPSYSHAHRSFGKGSGREVQDFFNLEDTSDIVPGNVVYYQDETYHPEEKENIPSTTGPLSMQPLVQAVRPINFPASLAPPAATPEPDYYQENYKEKYEAETEQREIYLASSDHAVKSLRSSRHAAQTNTGAMGVGRSVSATLTANIRCTCYGYVPTGFSMATGSFPPCPVHRHTNDPAGKIP